MLRRFAPPRALLLLPLLATAAFAACEDESPTLTGGPFFPGGRPVTLEVLVPATQYLDVLGTFTGFAGRGDFPFQVVANDFDGVLDANTLLDFAFPEDITYSQGGVSQIDTMYGVRGARLVVIADSVASARTGPTTVELYELAQSFHAPTANWFVRSDTGAVGPLPWATPGGTRGPLLATDVYARGFGGDSLEFALDSLTAARLRSLSHPGVLLAAQQGGRRIQIASATLIAQARPSNAARDTTVEVPIPLVTRTFVFNPQPPAPAGTIQAGGIFAARTLFSVDLDRTVPGCPPPESCDPIPLSQVSLNRVSLLLSPVGVPDGFDPLDPVPLTVWTVSEPELGRRAPLEQPVLDPISGAGQVINFLPTDTVVELPFTAYAIQATRNDSLTTSFALLGEGLSGGGETPARTFGVAFFANTPRLRIVYTLPNRQRLP